MDAGILLAAVLACPQCHAEIVAQWARSPMANSSGIVRAGAEPVGETAAFSVNPSGLLRWPGGAVQLSFFIGSRRMGRSYGYEQDGHLYQAPAGYYANRGAWDFAPGYERDRKLDFSRPITSECLACHTTKAVPQPGQLNRYASIVHGIGCERCHGEAAGGDHDALIQPSKLPPRLRDSICEQCHLAGSVRLERAGRRMRDFRPGQDLADYLEVFVGATPAGVRVNGHAEALAQSRCKIAAQDRLWCGTCHNPHRATNVNTVCQSCHTQPHQSGDCTGCHMPKARAMDGGHTVFTDHAIGAAPAAGSLRSYFRRAPSPRDLGLAYVELGTKNRDAASLEKAWPLLRASPQRGDPPLLNAIAGMLAASGYREQAVIALRRSIEADPVQPDALRRLAALVESPAEAQALRARAAAILPAPVPVKP